MPATTESYPDSNKSSKQFTASWSSGPDVLIRDRKYVRSKSLVNLSTEGYTNRDIRILHERLLRTQPHPQPAAIRQFSRTQKLTLLSLALVDFMSFCSMSIMAPFFPKEAAEKGMSDTMSGFVFSFYALVMFISSPIFGKILPQVGPKFLFMTGIFVAGLCNLLFGTLEYINDYTLFTVFCLLIRGVEALGASAYSTASYVFVVNTFPTNIGTVIGILETFVGLGMSTGPAIGGVLYLLGGFALPFYVLGIVMVLIIPINICLLPTAEECNVETKSGSIWKLIKVPAVIVTGLTVVIVSNVWGFLDPTLEPHLRQFNLSPEKIGLIFLLFSALYGISSPAWGWLADKVHHHWSMMVFGLLFCTVGLLLLGPCPYLPFLTSSLWMNLLSLSILGVSVALALLPTFPAVLSSAIEGGCGDTLTTYSIVAGVWSCMYSLGEVIGPLLGGLFLQHFGFPMAATVMAAMTFSLAILTLIFFLMKEKRNTEYERISDSGISASWNSSCSAVDLESTEDVGYGENQPLLSSNKDSDHILYTMEKVMYYEQSRKQDKEDGDIDFDQVTDVRGTVAITGGGACEV